MGAEKPPNDDKIQAQAAKDGAAQHVNPTQPDPTAERYPPCGKDDGVEATGERRSFENIESAEPGRSAEPDPSVNPAGLSGDAEAAEGKR